MVLGASGPGSVLAGGGVGLPGMLSAVGCLSFCGPVGHSCLGICVAVSWFPWVCLGSRVLGDLCQVRAAGPFWLSWGDFVTCVGDCRWAGQAFLGVTCTLGPASGSWGHVYLVTCVRVSWGRRPCGGVGPGPLRVTAGPHGPNPLRRYRPPTFRRHRCGPLSRLFSPSTPFCLTLYFSAEAPQGR